LQVNAPGGTFTPSCGSPTLTAPVAATTIQFAGGSVAPGQTCIVTIPVITATALSAGDVRNYLNNPVTLSSTQAAPVTVGPVTWTATFN
jgi:hypothetical protein